MHKKSHITKFLEDMSPNSRKAYRTAMKKYEKFHNMTFDELIEEALKEQGANTPEHELTIYDRLEEFKEWEMEQFKYNTIQSDLTKIKNIYKRSRVRLPYLPPIEIKHCKNSPFIEYHEILSKDEIKKALPYFKGNFQARILTMATGGYSLEETSQMTLEQFIEDLYPYHQQDNTKAALLKIAETDNLIWVTKMIRQKTKKPYYGMVNPETTQLIAKSWLHINIEEYKNKHYKRLERISKERGWDNVKIPLFRQTKTHVTFHMGEINDLLDFGKAGDFRRFTPHCLRRYNATHLSGASLSDEEEMKIRMIDELQGRSMTSTQERYIKTNPLKQKLLYAKVMNNVSLFNTYTYEIFNGDVVVHRVDPSSENKKLRKENEILKANLKKYSKSQNELEKFIESIGKDNFQTQLSKLLGGL